MKWLVLILAAGLSGCTHPKTRTPISLKQNALANGLSTQRHTTPAQQRIVNALKELRLAERKRSPTVPTLSKKPLLAFSEDFRLTLQMFGRLLIVGLLSIGVGCQRQAPPSPAEPAADGAAPPAVPSPHSTRTDFSSSALDDAQMTAVLGELTQAVRKYSVERRRVPKTLDELVVNGYLARVPEAPEGKRFAISKDLQVQLVRR